MKPFGDGFITNYFSIAGDEIIRYNQYGDCTHVTNSSTSATDWHIRLPVEIERIEEGEYYQDNKGTVYGPMYRSTQGAHEPWPWKSNERTFHTTNGAVYSNGVLRDVFLTRKVQKEDATDLKPEEIDDIIERLIAIRNKLVFHGK